MKLCKHVEYDWDNYGVTVTRGVAIPIFGWSRELEADVPLLKCAHCDKSASLLGAEAVYLNRGAWKDRKATAPDEDEMDWEEFDEGGPHSPEFPEGGRDPSEVYASEMTIMNDDDEEDDIEWG